MPVNNTAFESENRKKPSNSKINVTAIISVLATFIIFAVLLIFCYLQNEKILLFFGAALLIAYICIIAVTALLSVLRKGNKNNSASSVKETDDFPLGILSRLNQPTAVCNEDGNIVWMNQKFAMRSQKQILISDDLSISTVLEFKNSKFVGNASELTDNPAALSPNNLFNTLIENSCGVTAKGSRLFGGEFTVHAYPHSSNGTPFFILILTEDTERNEWITKHNNNLTHIAYIAVDNLEDLAQSDQENYRTISNQAAATIKEWSNEYGAFLKEYEREKYIAVISHKSLVEIEKKRFDLLEKVSRIRIDDKNLTVTISAGVSPETGTLEEKDRSAQSALEMALQRGGNQAVLMGESPRFFGAKAITSLKRSGVRHRMFADKLLYRIQQCSNVIIMGHRNPDFDAIGSCIGLARLSLAFEKQANIIANTEDPNLRECFEKLSGLPEYENIFVDATEAQEMISANTLVICSDVNNPDNFEALNVAKNADYLFIVDHHRQSEKTPESVPGRCETLIVPSASSASELVSEILELELPDNAKLHREEADIMFAGIMLDTKNFTRNTQVPTFGAAIYLRNCGADPNKAQALFKIDLDGFKTESAFSTDLEIYRDFIAIAKETGSESSPEKRITAAKTADRLLNIKKIRVSFVVARMLNDVFISARSDGSVNVQLIMEMLKGGGHYNAAATMLREISVDEAVLKLKEAITAYFGTDDQDIPTVKKRRRRTTINGKRY